MRDLLQELRDDLLRAGLSPRHIERYLQELSEHRVDIADFLVTTGLTPDAARRQAEQRLGDREALLLPMLADRRFRSHAARWPALFYIFLPLALQVALVAGGILMLAFAASTGLRPALADLCSGVAVLLLFAPVLIAWLTLLASHRRRMSVRWPVLGAFAGAALAAALQLEIVLPAPGPAGQIAHTLSTPSHFPMAVLAVLSLLPLSLQLSPK